MPQYVPVVPAKKPKSMQDVGDAAMTEEEKKRKAKKAAAGKAFPVTRGARRKSLDDAIEAAGG